VDWRCDRHDERKNAREDRPAARVAARAVGIKSGLTSSMRGRKEGVLGKNAHVEEVQVKGAAGRRPGVWTLRLKRKKEVGGWASGQGRQSERRLENGMQTNGGAMAVREVQRRRGNPCPRDNWEAGSSSRCQW